MGTITQKENDIFLHMGCDNELAKKAAMEAGAVVLDQIPAGSKLLGSDEVARKYFSEYRRLVRKLRKMTSITPDA